MTKDKDLPVRIQRALGLSLPKLKPDLPGSEISLAAIAFLGKVSRLPTSHDRLDGGESEEDAEIYGSDTADKIIIEARELVNKAHLAMLRAGFAERRASHA